MNLGELFDGQVHHLDPAADFQIPWEEVVEWVALDPQPAAAREAYAPLEVQHVVRELTSPEQGWWGIGSGWTSCNVMAQALAAALGGVGRAVEKRIGDDEDPFRPDRESVFEFQFVPGGSGWQGGRAL